MIGRLFADRRRLAVLRRIDRPAAIGIAVANLCNIVNPECVVIGGDLSLAIEVTLQPTDKTLTEADLAALSDKVVASAAKLGASLRT